jgi:hypothetical protein
MGIKIMGSVTFTQSVSVKSGRTPDSGNQVMQKDFEIYPAETISITDWNENLSHRFAIPVGAIDTTLCIGTLNEVKVLIIKPEADITLKLINSNGTSQNFIFTANRISIMHTSITGILASNPTATPIKGVFYVAGD